jgi:autotransporter-associated beta strand protein
MLLCSALLCAICAHKAHGQLAEIHSTQSPFTEDFDQIGSADTALLPLGWRIGQGSLFTSLPNATSQSGGTTGDGTIQPQLGGHYNFAHGDNATSTDRAVGFLSTNLFSTNRSLLLGLENRSGAPINDAQLSFDVEKYRTGLVGYDMHFLYSFDSTNWTQVPEATVHFNSDSSSLLLHPPLTVSRSISLSSLAIPNQGTLYLRWHYLGSSTNGQALGIDNVRLDFGVAQLLNLWWNGTAGASWDSSTPIWKNTGNDLIAWNDGPLSNAIFSQGASEVAIGSPRQVGRLTFDAGIQKFTLSGAAIEIAGLQGIGIDARSDAEVHGAVMVTASQAWDVRAAVHLSGPLTIEAGKTLTKIGAGTLRLSGPQNIATGAAITVTDGNLRLASNANSLKFNLAGNADELDSRVILESDQDWTALNISIADPGRQGLDLATPATAGAFRSLRIHAPDLQATKSVLHNLIGHARANPNDGIFDSGASTRGAALGVAAMPGGFILIRPTRPGDLNLDGTVTIADFLALAGSFNRTGVTWQEGDINHDTTVTIADFLLLASNFNTTYSGASFPISPEDQANLNAFAAAHGVSLPEPALAGFLLLSAISLLHRPRIKLSLQHS